jgi:hypothetical protein
VEYKGSAFRAKVRASKAFTGLRENQSGPEKYQVEFREAD